MPKHSREDALSVAEELGWTIVEVNRKGYTKLHCPCGAHKKWLHKTPSNPNHFKEAIAYMRGRACSPAQAAQVVSMANKVVSKRGGKGGKRA